MDVTVTGANDLAQVAGAINRLVPELRKEYLGAIRKVSKPLATATQEAAKSMLPHGGGLNEFVADSKIAVRTRTSGQMVGVRIVTTKPNHDLEALDAGNVRHPVFGNRKVWVLGQVRPGFFTETIRDRAPQVQAALVDVMETFLKRIKQESHT